MLKKLVAAVVLFAGLSSVALASCPVYAPYGCHPVAGGKMSCGCGQ